MRGRKRKPRISYQVVPYDHHDRWLCIKDDQEAYLVELDYFGKGQHACGCHWFEYHKWDGRLIKPCKHIKEVLKFLYESD
jgi:hypothetical protein